MHQGSTAVHSSDLTHQQGNQLDLLYPEPGMCAARGFTAEDEEAGGSASVTPQITWNLAHSSPPPDPGSWEYGGGEWKPLAEKSATYR